MPEPPLVRIQAHGKTWTGMYEVLGKLVHLSSAYGARKAPVGRRRPENVAKDLLAECVEAWWNRGDG
jgi:hypothetical protein